MRTPTIVLALLSMAVLGACSNGTDDAAEHRATSSPAAPAPGDELWGRTFFSSEVSGTPIPGGGPLEVAFPENGQIAVSAGCNRGVGSVELSEGVVRTGAIATTRIGCAGELAEADAWMTDFFLAEPTWSLVGDTLTLTSPETTVLLTDDDAGGDRPLVGTTWVVDALISPTAVSTSPALETAAPTLTIAEAGAVTGSTGCNRYTGAAQASLDTVTFGPITATQIACEPDVAEVERAVLDVLEGEVSAAVDGDTLELLRPDGFGLRLHAS